MRQAPVSEQPDPQAVGDVFKIEVLVAPMCTEWQSWRNGKPATELGHEAVGVVVDAAASTRLKVGDRVIAMPLMLEHFGVPEYKRGLAYIKTIADAAV